MSQPADNTSDKNDKNVHVNSQEEALEVLGKALEDSPLKRWISPPEPDDPSVPHVFYDQNSPANNPPVIKKVLTRSMWRYNGVVLMGCGIPFALFAGLTTIAVLAPQQQTLWWFSLVIPAWLLFSLRKAKQHAKDLAQNGQLMLGEVTNVQSGQVVKVSYDFVSPKGDILHGHIVKHPGRAPLIKAGRLVWVVYLDDETHGLA